VRAKLFLAGIAGADTTILREARSELNRYAAMGAVIVMTAAMACVSAGFAMVMAMQVGLPAAIAVGLLWSAVVFNLDRLMVTQLIRQKARRSAVLQAMPRVFIAVVLGAVISTPLVLRLFELEINHELQTMRQEAIDADIARRNGGDLGKQIAQLQTRVADERRVISDSGTLDISADPDVANAKRAYDAAENAYRAAYNEVIREIDGTGGTGKIGHGPAFREKQRRAEDLKAQRDRARQAYEDTRARVQGELGRRNSEQAQTAREQLEADQRRLAALTAEQESSQRDSQEAARKDQGLLARLEALERLSEGRPLLLVAHLGVFLLFAAIELMPVLMKLLQTLGPETTYERLLRSREHEYEVEAQSRLWSHYETERIRAALSVRLEQHRAGLALEAGQAANAEVVRAQRGVLNRLLTNWAEHTVGQVDADLRRWREGGMAAVTGPIPTAPADNRGRAGDAGDAAEAGEAGEAGDPPGGPWTTSAFAGSWAGRHHDRRDDEDHAGWAGPGDAGWAGPGDAGWTSNGDPGWTGTGNTGWTGTGDPGWASTRDPSWTGTGNPGWTGTGDGDRTRPVDTDRTRPDEGPWAGRWHTGPTTGPITGPIVTARVVGPDPGPRRAADGTDRDAADRNAVTDPEAVTEPVRRTRTEDEPTLRRPGDPAGTPEVVDS
jgi:hypothetical protein